MGDNCRKYYSCDVTGTLSLELCYDNWLFSAPKQYCDFPENVECGDRPLCDENDANCEEHHVTTYAPLVPCPVDCPPDLVNVELEPCSSEYCTCTNGIGYLGVRGGPHVQPGHQPGTGRVRLALQQLRGL